MYRSEYSSYDSYAIKKEIAKQLQELPNDLNELREIFEDERLIEEKVRLLANRQISIFKSPVTQQNWENFLSDVVKSEIQAYI